MPSPFDLRGPEFLVFYIALGAVALLVLYLLRYVGQSSEAPRMDLSDPYLIAYLRGGQNEVLRVATVSLIDRGFLEASGTKVSAVRERPASLLRLPLEQHLYNFFAPVPAEASLVFKAREFDREAKAYEKELAQLDFVPGTAARNAQTLRLGVALLVLWMVAAIKLAVAFQRGRSNVAFLILLAVVFSVLAGKAGRPRITRSGAAMVASLRTLFSGLKDRASLFTPGADATDVLMLAAVFGIAAMPATVFPHVRTLYPRAAKSASSGCGSSCGSSCGSGCGGGGCGGGCGGCGS
ncbi:MAG TPA: TIGR04222 domain-containing membrane protein [Bryobacteraceae bacterium]|nr:TIGR04222 domain-containing membrane protein [Bryobacteraceae bacterium]